MMDDDMAELWFEQQYAQDMEAMQEAEAPEAIVRPSSHVTEAEEVQETVPSMAEFAQSTQPQQSEHMREIMSRINEFSSGNMAQSVPSTGSLMSAFKRPASKHVGFLEEPFAAAGFGAKLNVVSASGFLHERPQLGEDTTTCVLGNGTRFHLKYRTTAKHNARELLASEQLHHGGLLQHSMQELQQIAERELVKRKTLAALQPLSNSPQEFDHSHEKQLWVEKYAPMSFSQLLSHEKTNREVLKAVKEWDSFVFKSAARKYTASEQLLQEDGRPITKVILLCGPPGTGKTTLAHVVVKHAGYRPVELNASDDRSAGALKETLERAMNGRSVIGEPLPNAIILDEIDGIDGRGAIDALLQIIKAPLKTKNAKGSSFPLTRPLICICNDQYAPQLRELRKIARIFQFQRVNDNRLSQRLKAICVAENLTVNSSALTALAAASASDIRSSINTMQLAAARYNEEFRKQGNKAQPLSSILLAAVQAGLKDEERDIFQMWQCVFRGIPSNTKSGFFPSEQSVAAKSTSSTIMDMGSAFSEIDVLTQGLHENFLLIPFNDPTMRKISSIYHWFEFMDLNRTHLFETGSAAMFGVLAVAMHLLCNVNSRVRLQLPSKDRDHFFARVQHDSIVQSYLESRSLQSTGTTSEVAVQVVPHLLRIISPSVRHVPVEVMNEGEKATMNHLVTVMLSCGMTFRANEATMFSRAQWGGDNTKANDNVDGNEQNDNNPSTSKPNFMGNTPLRLWNLEPALDQLVSFGSPDTGEMATEPTSPAAKLVSQELREWLSHEIELAAIRRNDAAMQPQHLPVGVNTPLKSSSTASSRASPLSQELAKRAAPKIIDIESPQSKRARNALGFLANFKPPKRRQKSDSAAAESGLQPETEGESEVPAGKRARIRFNKGFTNAVRRPALMNDFLSSPR